MKKILIINGHPNESSFNSTLASAYIAGAEKSGNNIKYIATGKLDFNPNLQFGYQKRTELEPDMLKAWEKIKWAEHIVWIYPQWWGFMPSILKGFIDRLFLPGFAYQPAEGNSITWEKLLQGKSSHIINTMDYPVWYYKWILRERGTKIMKNNILSFVGIKTVKTTYIGPIKNSSQDFREKWIKKINYFGQRV